MSLWERKLLTLLLATTYRPIELPLEELLRSLQEERSVVRSFWGKPNRILFLHLLLARMRERDQFADLLVPGWWPSFLEYLDREWLIYDPRLHRKIRARAAFKEIKRRYDLDTNKH